MTDLLPDRTITDVRDKYRRLQGEYLFTGVQALVRVPYDVLRADRLAGHRTSSFVSGYQGSPLGTLDLELGRQQAISTELGLVFNPGLNEELAATSVMGSQLVPVLPDPTVEGVLGIWYGKAPGLDRATDALRHANYLGTSRLGGALAYVGDDPAAKSSSLPSSSEHALHDLRMPTLFPGTVQEVLDFGIHGVALSRTSGLWTAIKVVSAVADGSGAADVAPDRFTPSLPVIEHRDGIWTPHPDGGYMAYQSPVAEQEIVEVRQPAALTYVRQNPGINEITVDPAEAWLGIVASGRTYYEVAEALHLLGLHDEELARYGVRLLRLGMITPLDHEIVGRFADGLEEIVVVEDSGPFLEAALRDQLYGRTDPPRVLGRRDELGRPLLPGFGSHVADSLIEPLVGRLTRRIPLDRLDRRARLRKRLALTTATATATATPTGSLPARQAYFCSGCPHNSSTKVPDGTLVGAGIGCHSMVALMDEDRVGTVLGITQMGGEGAQWIGMSPFVAADHIVQNLGDGTLSHSGSLAIRASIAAGTNITYKVLYNSAVAMTGGQDVAGLLGPVDLAREVLLEGAAQVVITTDDTSRYRKRDLPRGVAVRPREQLLDVQRELALVPGVTVLIHDQQCAAEKRRDRKRGKLDDPPTRVVINERVCEGCGDCGDVSNCLSVQPVDTEFGRKTRIDQSSCNKDYSCLRGDCPSFLTVEPVADTRLRRFLDRLRRTPVAPGPDATAPEVPRLQDADLDAVTDLPHGDITIRMPGIGGTGVITVSQVLATAAVMDGRHVQGLDQTGFSQKAGAVISDVRISDEPIEGTSQATAGAVDLYLVFDLLVALAEKNLAAVDPERTVAIVSTSRIPTGKMVTDTSVAYPETDALLAELAAATRGDRLVAFDAIELATALFGSATTANVLSVGAAYQAGLLPVTAAAIEAAIELNGAAVQANVQAFRYGRLLVQDRRRVEELAAARRATATDEVDERITSLIGDLDEGEVGRLLRVRVPDLIAFQNEALARDHLDLVRRVRRAERAVDPTSTALTEAVVRGDHKLLAYKDEYEVARLHLEAAADAVAGAVPGRVRYAYNLHPPILRSLGMDRKIRLGTWFTPAFRLLAAAKVLRGTPLDVFGYAAVRRTERRLVREYRAAIDAVTAALTAENLADAVTVAELADLVRGYEHIKLGNVERFRAELAERLPAFAPPTRRKLRRG